MSTGGHSKQTHHMLPLMPTCKLPAQQEWWGVQVVMLVHHTYLLESTLSTCGAQVVLLVHCTCLLQHFEELCKSLSPILSMATKPKQFLARPCHFSSYMVHYT